MRRREALRTAGGALALPALSTSAMAGRAAAQDDDGFEPIGRLELTGAKEAVVGDDGLVYVAVTDGYAVVDVSDPAEPELVHEDRDVLGGYRDGPLERIYDVKVDGDLLAVTGPANPGSSLQAVVVYDVSDPSDPGVVSVHETDFFNHNCDVSDGVVFLCGNDGDTNPLVTVDAETGEELGRWSVVSQDERWREAFFVNWPLHDVWAREGVAILSQWDSGTWMLDVEDPADPTLVGRVRGEDAEKYADMSEDEARETGRQPPGNDHFAAVNDDGTIVGISVEAWDVDPPEDDVRPGSVHLYDVGDPSSPSKLSEIPAPKSSDEGFDGVWTTSHNFEFRGDRLFTSWYRGGVKVHDVSDPANPEQLAHWRNSETTSFWTAQYATEEFFVASSRKDPRRSTETSNLKDGTGAALFTFPVPALPTPTPSATQSPSASATDDVGSGTPDVPQPGFGLFAGATALGLGAAWRRLRRGDE